jgi:magnesium-transporting ATPase (P-type)
VAMLRYAADMIDMDQLREDHEVVFEILFNSKRKWNMMITSNKKTARKSSIVEGSEGEVELDLMMKGAAEILIEMCSTIATKDGGEKPLDEIEKQSFLVSSAITVR